MVELLGMKKAFSLEFKRQKLAKERKYSDLKNLYSSHLPEIKDLNKPIFWNEIFSNETLNEMDYGMVRDRVSTAVSYIPDKKRVSMLDIGAGMGYVEDLISKKNNIDVYANDFSDVSIQNLKKKHKGNFKKMSIYSLKYSVNFFDVVLILEVLEHIPPSKIFNVLHSINKIIKRNGFLIVSVPMNEGLERMKDNPNGHVRMYTKELIFAELEMAGFKIKKYKLLYAFNSYYNLKSLIARYFKTHNPNVIVIKAQKI